MDANKSGVKSPHSKSASRRNSASASNFWRLDLFRVNLRDSRACLFALD